MTTTIAIRLDAKPGEPAGAAHGTVSVTVALDAAALAQVGGLAGRIDIAGLAAAGWRVAGPTSVGAGATRVTTVTATHPFTSVDQLPAVLSGVAAAGGHPLVEVSIRRTPSFWATRTTLSGTVDLRCGLSCFGDAGLTHAFGSVVGVSPTSLERQYGETPAEALRFRVTVALPGRLVRKATNGVVGPDGVVSWTPTLGSTLTLTVATTQTDEAHVRDAKDLGTAVAALLLLLILVLLVRAVRRRRPRRWARRRPTPTPRRPVR